MSGSKPIVYAWQGSCTGSCRWGNGNLTENTRFDIVPDIGFLYRDFLEFLP